MASVYGMGLTVARLQSTTRRQFTFYHQVLRISWYSYDRPRKGERLSRPWSYLMVLNSGRMVWESSALTT